MNTTTTTTPTRLAAAPRILDTLESFAADLAGKKKLRPRAIETYIRAMRRFAAWLGEESTHAEITEDAIGRYQIAKSHLAPATIGKELSAIRAYCRFLIRAGLRQDDPTLNLERPRRAEPLPRALSNRDLRLLERILQAPLPALARKARTRIKRDRRIVLLGLFAGLRLSEIAALNWKDVDLDAETITVKNGKGGKDRVVTIAARLLDDLKETPEELQRGAVAGHADGRHLSYKSIPHVFNRWLKDAGLDISAHQLRHTYAVTLLRNGADIRTIQTLLGHSSLAVTERYLALDLDDKRAATAKLPYRFD